ncbi:MAG: AAA family ATPase [Chloroflexota bacterium]|nr:AAA family ATPase [Chloroflexota bacterium]|tara:strand:+ start:2110 stop:4542 length:2433 start_codon:yes stop_codon:yes gene_type:complete
MVLPRREDYTNEASEALERAHAWASDMRNAQLDAEHLALGMLSIKDGMATKIFEFLGVELSEMKKDLEFSLKSLPTLGQRQSSTRMIYIEPRLKKVLDEAQEERQRLNDDFIAIEHLLKGLLSLDDGEIDRLLKLNNITMERIYHALKEIRGSQRVSDQGAEKKYQALEKYSVDLTKLARAGQLDPVVGRDSEIQRVVQTLTRRTKNNPVIIGDAGVGKTALVEGLAQRIVIDDVPESLKNRKLLKLEMASLLAGAKFRGEFEERLTAVMDEIRAASGEIVLFIDEIHIVVGAGGAEGAIDASNMMKPALARGEMRLIGATTPEEYRKYIESDKALERRFTPVNVNEPDQDIAVEMLKFLRPRYEKHHKIVITDSALEASVNLSARYITDRFLPDKAIDLIDEAAAKVRIDSEALPDDIKDYDSKIKSLIDKEEAANGRNDYEAASKFKSERLNLHEEMTNNEKANSNNDELIVDSESIATLISERTDIPVTRLVEKDKERLINLEEKLHERLVGQDDAVVALSNAIRRQRSGVSDPKRPVGTFIFLGPTGVGKTELARALAESLFDDEDNLVRIDMSEYMDKGSATRLIGAPPGYVGYDDAGQLTEAVRKRPFRVILFDEIEKAHPDVMNLLLQLLDDGRLTDGHGRTVNFRNSVIIMTSNLGSSHIAKESIGFSGTSSQKNSRNVAVEEALVNHFRPEFLNRIDETIIFDSLSVEELSNIAEIVTSKFIARVNDLGISMKITKNGINWLVENGFDKAYGARPLKRVVQRSLENEFAKKLLSGEFQDGDSVVVTSKNNKLVINKSNSKK